jgi:replicative DNA helicase
MTPTPAAHPGRDRLQGLVAGATEAEADQDRHRMEEAILATLAKAGTADPFRFTFDEAYSAGTLTFSRADLRNIADALSELVKRRVVVDTVLVRDTLKDAEVSVPDAVLSDILAGSKAVDATVAGEYIKKLAAFDLCRRAEEAGCEYLAKVKVMKGAADVAAAFADLSKAVFSLAHAKKLVREHPTEAEAAKGFLDALAARRADGRDWLGLDSGFRHLNEVLNGLGEGVFVLAGAPSTGKTTLAKQIADSVAATEKVPVLFWSFEQSAEELRIKSLARLSEVDTRAIWKGRTDNDTWAKVEKAADAYRRGPGPWLTIIEAGRTDTVEAIRAAALMAKYKAGDKPVLLVLDYLQIVPGGPDAPDTVRERVDYVLSELRRLSRDLKSPVLVVSSENREAYKGNKRPTLAALKESGGIEYSADAVLCLWRDNKESERLTRHYSRKTVRVEVHVLKNRNGELAKVKLDFTPAWALFFPLDDVIERGKEDLDYDAALGE